MAYVPGHEFDVFVSYAHGDSRAWIGRLVDRLQEALTRRGVDAAMWMDKDDLRRSRDFNFEIPDSLKSSATFLFFPSPTYVRSQYCVKHECGAFQKSVADRRARFQTPDFTNELFAFRCPIMPVDGNEHWRLLDGLTDISFCDETDTFPFGSHQLDTSFRRLVGEIASLLKRMRNHSTPVFLYPRTPDPELKEARSLLAAELSAQSYRIVPDRETNLTGQLRDAFMSVWLLGAKYDDDARELVDLAAAQADKSWVVWCSPEAERSAVANQVGFCAYLEELKSTTKTFLNSSISPIKLKEEVLALLRPDAGALPVAGGKPRVYLVYNSHDMAERKNAGRISFHYQNEFAFEHPDNPALHTRRLSGSDGVLLVWGHADEEWCSHEFEEIVQSSPGATIKGLCLFDPKEAKLDAVRGIREKLDDIYIAEQFGSQFQPAAMEAFFAPIRQRAHSVQP